MPCFDHATWRGSPFSCSRNQRSKIAEGDYESKVPSTETIEVARVGHALNSMSEAIAQREREIEQLAYYDSLTHLPNRTLLLKTIRSGQSLWTRL